MPIVGGESGGSAIIEVANYSALPNPIGLGGVTYAVVASQGTKWLPGSLGGTYYPKGLYYSDNTNWVFTETPYNANQATVDIGINDDSFVTPKTFTNASKWNTKQDALVSGTNIKTIEGQSLIGSGNIDLSKGDVGLGNVDNTSDANKPVSTAQALADTATLASANTYSDGKVIDSIADSDTTHAPSRNAVFDALATKANGTGTANGTNTGDETGASIATLHHAASAKVTLVDADEITGGDSASSFSLIRVTALNVYNYIKVKTDLIYQTLLQTFATTLTALPDTITAAQAGSWLRINVAVPGNLTIPPNSSVAIPIGSEYKIRQSGAGAITLVAGVGVTLNAPSAILSTGSQYDTIILVKQATDSWLVIIGAASWYTAVTLPALNLKAPLASPTFTGDPKAPTPTQGDNDTSIATTAFVSNAITNANSVSSRLFNYYNFI